MSIACEQALVVGGTDKAVGERSDSRQAKRVGENGSL